MCELLFGRLVMASAILHVEWGCLVVSFVSQGVSQCEVKDFCRLGEREWPQESFVVACEL